MLLDHVNLACADPDAMAEFLERLGCARRGARPPSRTHGHWLYDDSGRPVVHLARGEPGAPVGGPVDHVAFRTDDRGALLRALDAMGLAYTERENRGAGVVQIKVDAPEGIVLEFQSPLAEG